MSMITFHLDLSNLEMHVGRMAYDIMTSRVGFQGYVDCDNELQLAANPPEASADKEMDMQSWNFER